MKRITAIAIAAAAILGCSYVGTVGAATCHEAVSRMDSQAKHFIIKDTTWFTKTRGQMLDTCEFSGQLKRDGITAKEFEELRPELLAVIADPAMRAGYASLASQLIVMANKVLDVGYYGKEVAR